jgi:thiol-disulfide isomerase/thioredoxin
MANRRKMRVAMKTIPQLAFLFIVAGFAAAQNLSGRWDGTARVSDELIVPVHLEFSSTGDHVTGALVDGDQRTVATDGCWERGSLTLRFAQYAVTLQAAVNSGTLKGIYRKDNGAFSYPLELNVNVANDAPPGKVPQIDGVWTIPTDSPKGEHAWRLVVHQTGPNVSATILRVDGDTGTLAGSYKDGRFLLSHFQDVRPAVLQITPVADGSLALSLFGPHVGEKPGVTAVSLTAWRPSEAKDIPRPDDFSQHTSVRDAGEPFRFSSPDLNGKLVSNVDPQFRGKVVLVNITGSWCPNCHDEAPYLAALYNKYHAQGLEIVSLDFEEPEQQHTLERLHSFIKKYGISYTYLLAGNPGEVHDKVPQAVNLNAWPTTFFVGRDGRVQAVETGFPSAGSAEFNSQVKATYVTNIERLLAKP